MIVSHQLQRRLYRFTIIRQLFQRRVILQFPIVRQQIYSCLQMQLEEVERTPMHGQDQTDLLQMFKIRLLQMQILLTMVLTQ